MRLGCLVQLTCLCKELVITKMTAKKVKLEDRLGGRSCATDRVVDVDVECEHSLGAGP